MAIVFKKFPGANHPNHRNAPRDATLYTNEFPSYDHMTRLGYKHKRIEHHNDVYVMGKTHTNNFFLCIANGI